MFKKISIDKKAVSLMLSYVLLISIVISLSIGVFAWLKYMSNVSPPADCKEGTSVVVKSYNCDPSKTEFLEITLLNNGRFDVDGVIVSVGNDTEKTPISYLYRDGDTGIAGLDGYFQFNRFTGDPVYPGDEAIAKFTKNCRSGSKWCNVGTNEINFTEISVIRVQPFVIFREGRSEKIICQNAVITQEIQNCPVY